MKFKPLSVCFYQVNGVTVLTGGPIPCFYRAATDNDRGGGDHSYASQWKRCGLSSLMIKKPVDFEVKYLSDNLLELISNYAIESDAVDVAQKVGFNVCMHHKVNVNGHVSVTVDIKPQGEIPPLPRVGVTFEMPKEFDHLGWYGRGPFECYPDRKHAAYVGIYETSVSDLHVPYIFPGECGGRADVRWVWFKNSSNFGILASTINDSPPMQMNASYYTIEELDKATHEEELCPGQNVTVIMEL